MKIANLNTKFLIIKIPSWQRFLTDFLHGSPSKLKILLLKNNLCPFSCLFTHKYTHTCMTKYVTEWLENNHIGEHNVTSLTSTREDNSITKTVKDSLVVIYTYSLIIHN